MRRPDTSHGPEPTGVDTLPDLARALRQLRRRDARRHGGSELTYRELAARTGWSRTMIGEYFTGKAIPPTDRLDTLVRLLGASAAEQRALATARDRLDDTRLARAAGPGPVQWPVLQEFPPEVPGFVGRTAELAQLDRLVATARDPFAAAIVAITGMGGVGKTALAVRWARQVANRFPDGQLYLDLRGYGPEEPLPPVAALAVMLGTLGVDPVDLPPDLPERAAQLRTLVADRRMLVVLDNASGVEQVRPLLPGSPSCLVLVTSRDSLIGLVARDGARRIELDVLTPAEAGSLLHDLVGDRATAEPGAAVGLAEQCGRLPLALRVAAEQAIARPAVSLSGLVNCLRSEERRLAGLGISDDQHSQVRTVFSWSYQFLPPDRARAFRMLGLHPGRDLDEHAVAALFGVGPDQAQHLLDGLRQAHLVQPAGALRYRMHDLVRAYARECAAAEVSPAEAHAARTRLFDFYRYAAAAAVRVGFAAEQPGADQVGHAVGTPAPLVMPPVAKAGQAREWLDVERSNLVAACEYAAGHGWPEHCIALSLILSPYLDSGNYQEALAVHSSAAAALGRAGHVYGHQAAVVLTNLGATYLRLGRFDAARDRHSEALAVARRIGDRLQQARALDGLGDGCHGGGDRAAALSYWQQALACYTELALPAAERLQAKLTRLAGEPA